MRRPQRARAFPSRLPTLLILLIVVGLSPALAASSGSADDGSSVALPSAVRHSIENRGALIPARLRARTERHIESTVQPLEIAARHDGGLVAARLAAEFGGTAESIALERATTGATWGDLLVAHTLAASLESQPTARELFKLHDDGMGWSEIAFGAGLELKEMLGVLRTECRVALGLAPADGRVAPIRGDRSLLGDGRPMNGTERSATEPRPDADATRDGGS